MTLLYINVNIPKRSLTVREILFFSWENEHIDPQNLLKLANHKLKNWKSHFPRQLAEKMFNLSSLYVGKASFNIRIYNPLKLNWWGKRIHIVAQSFCQNILEWFTNLSSLWLLMWLTTHQFPTLCSFPWQTLLGIGKLRSKMRIIRSLHWD